MNISAKLPPAFSFWLFLFLLQLSVVQHLMLTNMRASNAALRALVENTQAIDLKMKQIIVAQDQTMIMRASAFHHACLTLTNPEQRSECNLVLTAYSLDSLDGDQ